MADDKVMIIMTSGPDTPRRCATPFFFASLAVAMENEVTMFSPSTAHSCLRRVWLKPYIPKKAVNQ